MQMPNGLLQRHNLRELKDELLSALGAGVSQEYWSLLSNFLNYKLTKKEFDVLILKTVSRDHLRRHNHFIRAIFRNAVCAEAPPSPCGPGSGPSKRPQGLALPGGADRSGAANSDSPGSRRAAFPARSREKANGVPDNHVNVIATPPRGQRSRIDTKRKARDTVEVGSGGAHGVSRLSEKENHAVVSDAYERPPEESLPAKRQRLAELDAAVPGTSTSGAAVAAAAVGGGVGRRDGRGRLEVGAERRGREGEDAEMSMAMDEREEGRARDRRDRLEDGEGEGEEEDEEMEDTTVWLRQPVRPPIGLPFCLQSPGGTPRPQWGGKSGSSYPLTHSLLGKPLPCSHDDFDADADRCLPDNNEVERRASNIVRAECGLQGVSKEAVMVIREGMEHYLKRILQGCLEIVKTRRRRRNGTEVQEREGVNGSSWQAANGCHSPPRITVQDLMTATELHPELLGEEAAVHREWIQLLL